MRRLVLVLLAALAPVVAASPAGAAGHPQAPNPNTGIVDVYTTLGYEQAAAAGTGMILSRSGEVLTNNHVIRGATALRVVDVTTHKSYSATVVGYSVARDVAVLQLAGASDLKTIPLGRSGSLRVGRAVVARGNAQGRGGTPRAAAGKVLALQRQIVAVDDTGDTETLDHVIVTNAHVVPGDSGGPLEDAKGHAVGMVTAGSASSRTHRGFAIPISRALAVVRQIEAGASSATVHVGPTAFLGVVLQDVSGGAEVVQVVPGSAADAAGLVPGDVVTSLDGTTITSRADVEQEILSLVPGTAVPLGWTDASHTAQTGTITPAGGPPQ